MKGLELSRRFYEECGRPMLEQEFPQLLKYIAVGYTGRGSEHFGFDDDISADHDFEPGFCIFLPGEELVGRREAFLLERAYSKLPKEFLGIKRPPLSPVGGNRNGVFRTSEFYLNAAGTENGILSEKAWLSIPDYVLAEAVNGEIFTDAYGEVTTIRKRLKSMPDDIKRKKLAGNLLLMGQSGQYNFSRCLRHGEPEAAQLACNEFVNSAMKIVFYVNNEYMPFYKWSFRAFRALPDVGDLADNLSALLTGRIPAVNPPEPITGSSPSANMSESPALGGQVTNPSELSSDERTDTGTGNKNADDFCFQNPDKRPEIIDKITGDILDMLRKNGFSSLPGQDLEAQAYNINNSIKDGNIRNLSIFSGV